MEEVVGAGSDCSDGCSSEDDRCSHEDWRAAAAIPTGQCQTRVESGSCCHTALGARVGGVCSGGNRSSTYNAVDLYVLEGNGYGGKESDERAGSKPVCKFWKSDDGCRKGATCADVHENVDMKGRCYGCGGLRKKMAKVKSPAPRKLRRLRPLGCREPHGLGTWLTSLLEETLQLRRNCCLSQRLYNTLRRMKVLRVKELKPKMKTRGGAVEPSGWRSHEWTA